MTCDAEPTKMPIIKLVMPKIGVSASATMTMPALYAAVVNAGYVNRLSE